MVSRDSLTGVPVAELELYLSRPNTPTRRVALGESSLPMQPAPGYGGLLLGAVIADNIGQIDPDLVPDIHRLVRQLDHGSRIAQPRLRHRFQQDRVGLNAHRHRLLIREGRPVFDLDDTGRAAPHVLGALYAAGQFPDRTRRAVFPLLRRALTWHGPIGPDLIAHLTGESVDDHSFLGTEPRAWALAELGLAGDDPAKGEIQSRFRELLRLAHPDHGGCADTAAGRIDNLSRARRILLAD